jgi:hypothetical protein
LIVSLAIGQEPKMSRTRKPFVRTLSASGHSFSRSRSTPIAVEAAGSTVVDAYVGGASATDSNLPLVDVAGAVTAAVRGLMPSCASAIIIRVGGCWQILAQNGAADVALYHQRQLASLDLSACGVIRTERHLVAELPCKRAAACLLLVALPGREVPDRAHELVRAMLECAGPKLDAAVDLQCRDRALRRLELLGREARSLSHSVGDLEDAVASLWPRCAVRYVSGDELGELDHPTRRLIRSACSTATTVRDEQDRATLLRSDWVHRVAVPLSSHGALLVEPAAAGEALDDESVAAATAAARIWSLVAAGEGRVVEADRRSERCERT